MPLPSRRRPARQSVSEQPDRKPFVRLLPIAALAWLLVILDGATAVLMMQNRGAGAELNPLVRAVFLGLGPLAVILLKFALATIILTSFLYLARSRRHVLARNCLLMAVVLGGVGVLSNLG
jgi:Domain of unknown function (DUF5658)